MLAIRTMNSLFPNKFDFYPETWIYPQELASILSDSTKEPVDTNCPSYLFKPDTECRGTGIELLNRDDFLKKDLGDTAAVVQKYVKNPLLWGDCKFDIRSYFIFTSLDPLEIYYAEGCLVRICTTPFNSVTDDDTLSRSFQHITNTSINVKSDKFQNSTTRTLDQLKQMLTERGFNADEIERKLIRCCIKAFIA
uniref:Tubulin--tyrosine ligase-like protein 9 n=1 Tax=Ciona savignyi TaxID=51511 RepID=H2YH60_CIOSA